MMGYGYRWVMPMDYRRQTDECLAALTPLERYLVGEKWGGEVAFEPDGGANPLRDWCRQHGLPIARRIGQGGSVDHLW